MMVKRRSALPVFLTLMIVCLLTQTGVAQDSTGLGMVAGYQSFDRCRGIERYNDYYYLASGRTGLVVLHKEGDVFTRVYQNTGFEEPPESVFRDGDRLLVTGFFDKTIFDISNPANPVLLAHYDLDLESTFSTSFSTGVTKWRNGILIHREYHGEEISIERISEDSEPELLEVLSPVTGYPNYEGTSITESLIGALIRNNDGLAIRIWDYSDPENVHVAAEDLTIDGLHYGFAMSDSWIIAAGEYSFCIYDIRNIPTITFNTFAIVEDYGGREIRFIQIRDNTFYIYTPDGVYCYEIEDGSIELDSIYSDIKVYLYFNEMDDYGFVYNRWLTMVEVSIDESNELTMDISELREIFEGPFLVSDDHILTADLKAYSHEQEDQLDSVGVFLAGEYERNTLIAANHEVGIIDCEYHYGTVQLISVDPTSESGFCLRDTIVWNRNYQAFIFGENNLLYCIGRGPEHNSVNITVMEMDDLYSLTLVDSMVINVGLDSYAGNIIYNNQYLHELSLVEGVAGRKLISIDVGNPHDIQYEYQDLPADYLNCIIKASDDLMLVNKYYSGGMLDELDEVAADSSFVYSLAVQGSPTLIDTLRIPVGNQADYRDGYLLVANGKIQVYRYNPWSSDEPELVAEWGERYVWEALFLEDDRILATWETGMGLFAFDPTGIHEIETSESLPSQLRLSSYPNPANPETRITLELPRSEAVKVCVYDVLGREVARLHEGVLQAGNNAFTFGSQSGLASGVYFVRATAGQRETTQRIVLLK